MPNPDRLYDKTHLSLDTAEERGFIHRDYIAHCFRWSHVVKHLMSRHQYKGAHILDVGCGKDQPLPRLMYSNKMTGFSYTGVDINKMDFHPTMVKAHQNGKVNYALLEETDSSVLEVDDLPWGAADYVVAFEILEHIQPFIVHRMLRSWRKQLKPGGTAFVSTPVYNGSAAANHINEMGRLTLGTAFEHAGFIIDGNYGTFASISDIYPLMSTHEKSTFDRLRAYYDTNVLAVTMAPLYPEGSRNNLWVLRNPKEGEDGSKSFIEATADGGYDANQNPNWNELITGAKEG